MHRSIAALALFATTIIQVAAVGLLGKCDGAGYTGKSKTLSPSFHRSLTYLFAPSQVVSSVTMISFCVYHNDWYSLCRTDASQPLTFPPPTAYPSTTRSPTILPTIQPPGGGGGEDSLDKCFKSKGKLYWGAFTRLDTLQQEVQVIRQHFGQITPENSMQVDELHLP
jgi:endo-1,4-beta-xylanase